MSHKKKNKPAVGAAVPNQANYSRLQQAAALGKSFDGLPAIRQIKDDIKREMRHAMTPDAVIGNFIIDQLEDSEIVYREIARRRRIEEALHSVPEVLAFGQFDYKKHVRKSRPRGKGWHKFAEGWYFFRKTKDGAIVYKRKGEKK